MKVICVCVVILVVAALFGLSMSEEAPLGIGYGNCSWGPTYWCLNAETAKECGVTAEFCEERYGGFLSKSQSS